MKKYLFTIIMVLLTACASYAVWTPDTPDKDDSAGLGTQLDYTKANFSYIKSISDLIFYTSIEGTKGFGWDNDFPDNVTIIGPIASYTGDNMTGTFKQGHIAWEAGDKTLSVYDGTNWKKQAGHLRSCSGYSCTADNLGDLCSDATSGNTYYCDNATTWKLVAIAETAGIVAITDGANSADGTVTVTAGSGISAAVTTATDTLTIANTGVTGIADNETGVATGTVTLAPAEGVSVTRESNTVTIGRRAKTCSKTYTQSLSPMTPYNCGISSSSSCLCPNTSAEGAFAFSGTAYIAQDAFYSGAFINGNPTSITISLYSASSSTSTTEAAFMYVALKNSITYYSELPFTAIVVNGNLGNGDYHSFLKYDISLMPTVSWSDKPAGLMIRRWAYSPYDTYTGEIYIYAATLTYTVDETCE